MDQHRPDPLTEITNYRNVRLPKSPFTEMSAHRNFPCRTVRYRIFRYRDVRRRLYVLLQRPLLMFTPYGGTHLPSSQKLMSASQLKQFGGHPMQARTQQTVPYCGFAIRLNGVISDTVSNYTCRLRRCYRRPLFAIFLVETSFDSAVGGLPNTRSQLGINRTMRTVLRRPRTVTRVPRAPYYLSQCVQRC